MESERASLPRCGGLKRSFRTSATQGVPRLGLRWPKMIDTLLRRIKICCHSSSLSTMDAQAECIAGNTWAREAVKKGVP